MRLLSLLLFALSLTHPSAQEVTTLAPIRIVLIGDSTVSSYPDPPKEGPVLNGWGQVLGEFMQPTVEILNHARAGTSTKSFRDLNLWAPVLAAKPNYVFIQFGHNDQPGKPAFTDANGEYQDNLRRYIAEAGAAGAIPVLVTSVARRNYTKEGKLFSTLQPYVDAMKKVGAETKTAVIDLHATSFALFDQMGEKASMDCGPVDKDRTHFSRKGALLIARLVAEGIQREVPALKDQVRLNSSQQ